MKATPKDRASRRRAVAAMLRAMDRILLAARQAERAKRELARLRQVAEGGRD